MSNRLPGKRYRKNKDVFMWHLAGSPHWGVAITPEKLYWSERTWKDRDFKNFPEALAYAKKLANALENGQQRIQVIGSLYIRNAKLDGSEVVTGIPGKTFMIDMDVDREVSFAEKARKPAIEAGRRMMHD